MAAIPLISRLWQTSPQQWRHRQVEWAETPKSKQGSSEFHAQFASVLADPDLADFYAGFLPGEEPASDEKEPDEKAEPPKAPAQKAEKVTQVQYALSMVFTELKKGNLPTDKPATLGNTMGALIRLSKGLSPQQRYIVEQMLRPYSAKVYAKLPAELGTAEQVKARFESMLSASDISPDNSPFLTKLGEVLAAEGHFAGDEKLDAVAVAVASKKQLELLKLYQQALAHEYTEELKVFFNHRKEADVAVASEDFAHLTKIEAQQELIRICSEQKNPQTGKTEVAMNLSKCMFKSRDHLVDVGKYAVQKFGAQKN